MVRILAVILLDTSDRHLCMALRSIYVVYGLLKHALLFLFLFPLANLFIALVARFYAMTNSSVTTADILAIHSVVTTEPGQR